MNRVEILAPAGSMESLKAAVAAGCHAVYLGGEKFNARAGAANFSNEELKEGIRYCHLRGVKVYVTLNILLREEELEEALQYCKFLYEIGGDALIVQDLGLVRGLQNAPFALPLHGSTQLFVHNLEGAQVLKDLGFERVVLARETPLSEVRRIKEHLDMDIEFFVHGALCICYSGECLMSSMIGGRSGNRGACAQPCRKFYTVVDGEDRVYEEGFVISPKDLNTAKHIGELVEAGVDSLKIEGRMKRPEYVASVVTLYRHALEDKITKKDEERAAQSFNRGFTKGLPLGDFGRSFIAKDRPDNRGLVVGKVLSSANREVTLDLFTSLSPGDGLEFIDAQGSFSGGEVREFLKPGRVIFPFYREVKVGSEVRRTFSVDTDEELSQIMELDRRIPIRGELVVQRGTLPSLTVEREGRTFTFLGERAPEEAKSAPLTEHSLREQMDRLGDTPFYWEELSISLDEGLFLSKKDLNALRRGATEGEEKTTKTVPFLRALPPISRVSPKKALHVSLEEEETLKALDLSFVDKLTLPYNLFVNYRDKICDVEEVFLSLPPVFYGEEREEIEKIIAEGFEEEAITGLEIHGVAGISLLQGTGLKGTGSQRLNVTNSQSLEFYRQSGVDSVVLSPELTLKAVGKLMRKTGSGEVLAYGFVPVMLMEHCPMSLVKGCRNSRGCLTCEYRGTYYLKDSLNYHFPFRRRGRRTVIYHSRPLFLGNRVRQLGKNFTVKLSFTQRGEPVKEVTKFYRDLLDGRKTDEKMVNRLLKERYGGSTIGNYKRGALGGGL